MRAVFEYQGAQVAGPYQFDAFLYIKLPILNTNQGEFEVKMQKLLASLRHTV